VTEQLSSKARQLLDMDARRLARAKTTANRFGMGFRNASAAAAASGLPSPRPPHALRVWEPARRSAQRVWPRRCWERTSGSRWRWGNPHRRRDVGNSMPGRPNPPGGVHVFQCPAHARFRTHRSGASNVSSAGGPGKGRAQDGFSLIAKFILQRLSEPAGRNACLARVQLALRDGRAEEALQLLAAQDGSYGDGVLAEERAAARVYALCQVGRGAEARSAADSFNGRWPNSALGRASADHVPRPNDGVFDHGIASNLPTARSRTQSVHGKKRQR